MAPATISETGVTRVHDNPADPTQVREIAPPHNLGPQAIQRGATEAEYARSCRNVDTIGVRDLPGKGRTRKVKRACDQCGCFNVYFSAEDLFGWVGDYRPCDSCVLMAAYHEDDKMEIVFPHARMAGEMVRFRSDYPHISATLEPMLLKALGDPHKDAAFLGTVTRPRVAHPPVLDRLWLELLGRHAAGDHGDFGQSTTVKPTDDHKFAPLLYDVKTRNAVALEAGSGLVRSRFELPASMVPDCPDGAFRGQRWKDPRAGVLVQRDDVECLMRLDVATLIGQRTHCRVGAVGEQCFGA